MTEINIRVRFAPSPTGTLHVGGARTALFNWLFARSRKGTFILRIEDTDQKRYELSAEEAMIKDLKWLGLNWDEGPDIGGPFSPYRQSMRLDIYQKYALRLIENGDAYYCFCTQQRLDEVRAKQKEAKQNFGYDGYCRDILKDEAAEKIKSGQKYVIRLKTPREGVTKFNDFLRGEIEYSNSELDDLILIKSDGFPSYHLANVVDDHLMDITHVLRGDEWIPSTPKHVLIYKSFGWKHPEFVHLPVILAEGGGKLSKRKGASSVTDYMERGVLPGALKNFLALLGWSPGGDREMMDEEELIRTFGIDRINPKSCAFDEKKLEWMNSQYISQMPGEELYRLVEPLFEEAGFNVSEKGGKYFLKVLELLKDRCRRITDFVLMGTYFFTDPPGYDKKAEKKHFKPGTVELLLELKHTLASLTEFSAKNIEDKYRELAGKLNLPNAAELIHPTRLAVSGLGGGPGLFEIMELLSRDIVLRRLERAVEYLKENGYKVQ